MQPFASHAYPGDLARLVWQRWSETRGPLEDVATAMAQQSALPRPEVLERLFSVCYQASLLHEEGRLITFRVVLAAP